MRRRFPLAILGLAVLGFVVRMGYGLAVGPATGIGDDFWYHAVANAIADGRGVENPFAPGEPTAFHLPLFPALLAIGSLLGADSIGAHQAIGWLFGAGTVAAVGFAARRLAGEALGPERADLGGIIAAAIAAVCLPLAINDSLGFSESLYGLLVALTLLAALRLRARPAAVRALALGGALGLAALTRQEALLLAVLLVPVVLAAGGPRLRNAALMLAAVAALTLPWAVRNSLTFDQPVLLTTGDGSVVACANGHETYFGGLLGSCDHDIGATRGGRSRERNEARRSDAWREEGLDYLRDHTRRLPAVLVARVGRTWGFFPWSPVERARFGAATARHIEWLEYVAMAMFWVVLALAVWGAALIRRSRGALWLMLAPLLLVTLVSVAGYGDTRFRQAADVALVMLASVAVVKVVASSRG